MVFYKKGALKIFFEKLTRHTLPESLFNKILVLQVSRQAVMKTKAHPN